MVKVRPHFNLLLVLVLLVGILADSPTPSREDDDEDEHEGDLFQSQRVSRLPFAVRTSGCRG